MTVSERIADFAFKISFDKDATELEKILQAQGATTRMESDILFISKANYSTGISLGCDPITALATIIMTLWTPRGMLLPEVKEAFKIVNKEWGERVKVSKQNAAKRSQAITKKLIEREQLDFIECE